MEMTPDALVDRIAAGHYGLISREQARRCGLTPRQIEHRLRIGRWVAVCRGVYRTATAQPTWQQLALAACLAGPPETVTSHLTGAAVHGLGQPPSEPYVIVPPGTSGRRVPGRVHRSALTPLDRLVVAGIPVTSPARTLVDCAGLVGFHRLCDMVDTACCAGLTHPSAVAAAIERAGHGIGRRNVGSLRAALQAWSSAIAPGSPAEMRLLRKVIEAGLDVPARQIEIYDADSEFVGRIDLGWPHRRSGLEYDSDRFHNPRHWARDEARQLRYAAAGWDVRRVGKHDLLPSVTWLDDHLRRLARRLAA
jgi:Transcriptional regulator, AbiEi antitoxin